MHTSRRVTRNAEAIANTPVQAFCNSYTGCAGKDKPQLHQERHSAWMLLACHSVRLIHSLQAQATNVSSWNTSSAQTCATAGMRDHASGQALCQWFIETTRGLCSHARPDTLHAAS